VYHMYPWDQPAEQSGTTARAARRQPLTGPDRPGDDGRAPEAAVRAVQVALDRRDNGGAPALRRHQ
jgi:hypothetical protein